MALVIDLKPHEKILVGDAVITNDKQRTRLHIAGETPILREKDVMKEEDANSPCRRIYFLVQCMYLARRPSTYHEAYFKQIKEVQDAAPSTLMQIMKINDFIMEDSYYKALKMAKQLIEYEEELLGNARQQVETA